MAVSWSTRERSAGRRRRATRMSYSRERTRSEAKRQVSSAAARTPRQVRSATAIAGEASDDMREPRPVASPPAPCRRAAAAAAHEEFQFLFQFLVS